MKKPRGLLVENLGVGDAVQFTSLPENYFRHTGEKLVDVARHWVFDHNPFIRRDVEADPDQVFRIWNHRPFIRPKKPYYMSDEEAQGRLSVFTCNAEIHACLYDVPVVLNRPRLYRYEDFPFQHREMILIHARGRAQGDMPDHVVEHILKKYAGQPMAQVGLPSDPDIGIPKVETSNLWELAELISQCRMLIGMDSGPSWIAACYPDVIVKKLRCRQSEDRLKDWIPLDFVNNHSHWDDRAFQVFNPTEDDVGFASSYRRI